MSLVLDTVNWDLNTLYYVPGFNILASPFFSARQRRLVTKAMKKALYTNSIGNFKNVAQMFCCREFL